MKKVTFLFLILVIFSFHCGVCEYSFISDYVKVVSMPEMEKAISFRLLTDFADSFADAGGYYGKWRELPALGSTFCLPKGWYGMSYDSLVDGVTAFSGGNEDDTVGLLVTQWDSVEDGDYNGQTGKAFLEYVAESLPNNEITLIRSGAFEVVLYRSNRGDHTMVLVPQPKQVVCFGFRYDLPGSIEDGFAIAIAGTLRSNHYNDMDDNRDGS